MNEIWKDIRGYEDKYQISNLGRVKSLFYKKSLLRNERILKTRAFVRKNKRHYHYVVLSKNNKVHTYYIHRLVAEYFVANPENKPYVNHFDGNKANNIATNLEWVTPLENNLHAYAILGKSPGKGFKYDKNKRSKPVHQYYVSEEGYEYHIATYANAVIAAQINHLHATSIAACCRHKKMYGQLGGFIWRYTESESQKCKNGAVLRS